MKKKYRTPKALSVSEKIHSAALNGAFWLIVRSLMKGHIDLITGADKPKTLQSRR